MNFNRFHNLKFILGQLFVPITNKDNKLIEHNKNRQ